MTINLQHRWQRLNQGAEPHPHRGSSLVFDKKRQQSVLVAAGTTWLLHGTTWSQARSQNAPPGRNTTHLVYDPGTEHVLLFGGIGSDGSPRNDTWVWDGSSWTEKHVAIQPPPIGEAAMASHAAGHYMLLFGGIKGFDGVSGSNHAGTLSQATWTWDGSSWREHQVRHAPPARFKGQLIYDELRQQLLLCGGSGSGGFLNDMWRWDETGWQELHPATLLPAQAQYQEAYHQRLQQVVLLGEITERSNPAKRSHQIWLWDGSTWTHAATNGDPQGSIEGLAYDETRQALMAFVVTGEKYYPGKKGASLRPAVSSPTLASETWIWE